MADKNHMDLSKIKDLFDWEISLQLFLPSKEEIQEERLSKYWRSNYKSEVLIERSLGTLYNKSFIILYFDDTSDYFVQFLKVENDITLNFPFWKKTPREGKRKQFLRLLNRNGYFPMSKLDRFIHRSYKHYEIMVSDNGEESINVYFGTNRSLAADLTMKIGNSIYKIKNPQIKRCETGNLIPAKQS